MAQYIL